MNRERIIFSGSGGQGLLFIGKLLANMCLDRFPHVTFFPCYGAEVRGGTSNCQIVFSTEEIASPVVEEADSLVLMNQPSVDRFLPAMAPDGIAVINSSLARTDDVRAGMALIPATDIAAACGDLRVANVVMFGAYLRRRARVDLEEACRHVASASATKATRFVDLNTNALRKGWEFAEHAAG